MKIIKIFIGGEKLDSFFLSELPKGEELDSIISTILISQISTEYDTGAKSKYFSSSSTIISFRSTKGGARKEEIDSIIHWAEVELGDAMPKDYYIFLCPAILYLENDGNNKSMISIFVDVLKMGEAISTGVNISNSLFKKIRTT